MAEEMRMAEAKNFIQAFIDEDLAPGGQYAGMTVHTRFPPERPLFLNGKFMSVDGYERVPVFALCPEKNNAGRQASMSFFPGHR